VATVSAVAAVVAADVLTSMPAVAAAPAVVVVPAVAVAALAADVPVPVKPQLPVVFALRRDENDHLKAASNHREFHVLCHDLSEFHVPVFRNTEPSENSVRRFVASRRRMTKQEFVRESLGCAENWPKMFLRVKELEHRQSQEQKKTKQANDQKQKRAAKATAKAEVKAKAKAKTAA
jgi:hypothetical protein